MDVILLEEKEYIPDWNKNKKEANPVKIILQPLTAGQRAVLLQKIASDKDEEEYLNYACLHGIKAIENLSAGEKIETARQLLDSRGAMLEILILDIGKEIIVHNRRLDLKNS